MIRLQARLLGISSNPHDPREPWETHLFTLGPRGMEIRIPVSLEEALRLGPHVGQVMLIGIAPQFAPGTIQPRSEQ